MQIRLTVLGSRTDAPSARLAGDVLVTAPAGTALAAVAAALASAAGGDGSAALYAGAEKLDVRRCTLGEPPLLDGVVLSLGGPAEPGPEPAGAQAHLHVVAGPDAGGVHLLHGGRIQIGRSARADVPLDDPDVSRLHCAVTLAPDGAVSVADLGSTNGTTLDGRPVGERPVRLPAGALLRLGESALTLTRGPEPAEPLPTAPDGEGHVRVRGLGTEAPEETEAEAGAAVPRQGGASGGGPRGATARADGDAAWAASDPGSAHSPGPGTVPGQGGAPGVEGLSGGPGRGRPDAFGSPAGPGGPARPTIPGPSTPPEANGVAPGARSAHRSPYGRGGEEEAHTRSAYDTSPGGAAHPSPDFTEDGRAPGDGDRDGGAGRRRGLAAWARRWKARPADEAPRTGAPTTEGAGGGGGTRSATGALVPGGTGAPQVWPDPATLLLTVLGPGPQLWERDPDHPEALTVRLGTADRPAPGGGEPLPAVPVTVGLREAGALGLAGPPERLAGLARAVVAQLAALHGPDTLEIVLIAADRARPAEERTAEWGWLGWLPQSRPAHGQDCRLLLAFDREQAAARTGELLRRLDDRAEDAAAGAEPAAPRSATVLLVDGDPGSAALRDAVLRITREGPAAGMHVVCLATTAPASASSPVAETFEAACAVSPAFRSCGAVGLLSGEVATTLRLLRTAEGVPVGQGVLATVDAVSAAWADRFARALAPLRPEGGAAGRPRVSAPLPRSARLLDELGLARATPASLLARWAAAADDTGALGGRAWAVLGAGPRGPVSVDLAAEGAGPHLLVEGPPGSGRTELLRAVAASLASAERPGRLGLALVDGRDAVRGPTAAGPAAGAAEGLGACTELPHVTARLTADDPVRMREFAQSLTTELKRRAELLGRLDFSEWHTGQELSGRLVAQRSGQAGAGRRAAAEVEAATSATLRLRPGAPEQTPEPVEPLPRLVVLVDDVDALLSPPLGSTGRPAAGSVVRALEAVARDGARLGVHLVASTGPGGRTADSELGRRAGLRVVLREPGGGPEDPAPGRGVLYRGDGRETGFQGGRVTGRIPRTATLRPTVVPLEWARMGDPPARRSVRELGNGPTDLALLASAVERAAR
ncbi:FHA domain-containing protein [Streptomyces sp. NPDC058045]|uniref:FHA domain-containing protein n=1 Tax=Streptomyces sp. NPDC058045 TaxID=3346311 RepID=UPI0036ECE6F6